MHPRDPARSHGPRCIYCAAARYREIEMRLAAVPRPIFPSVSCFFSSTAPDILFNGHSGARAPFDIAVSLHKIQGLHKTALLAPLPHEPGHPGTRPEDRRYGRRNGMPAPRSNPERDFQMQFPTKCVSSLMSRVTFLR